MKPGHTVYFRDGGEHVKAVVHIAVGYDPKEKDHAIDLTNILHMKASQKFKVFDASVAETKSYEREYMDKNSRLYDRRSE